MFNTILSVFIIPFCRYPKRQSTTQPKTSLSSAFQRISARSRTYRVRRPAMRARRHFPRSSFARAGKLDCIRPSWLVKCGAT